MSDKKDPNASFQPIPSLGHELGILFGFAGLMFLCMVGYWIGWGSYQKKIAKVEADRRAALLQTDLYNDAKYNEKGKLRGQTEYKEDVASGE